MTDHKGALEPSVAHAADTLVALQPHAIGSRVVARSSAGNVTIFAMDAGELISEHTAPFDALVLVLDGALELTIGATPVNASAHDMVRMPAHVPHALKATKAARFLLVMLREPQPAL